MRADFGIGWHFQVTVDAEDLPDRHLHIGQTDGLLYFGHGGGRHQSSEVPGVPETRYVEWLRMRARLNLAESNGWQKPVTQSKFHCFIMKIGAVLDFFRAALRITPHFRLIDRLSRRMTGSGWHFLHPWRVARSEPTLEAPVETAYRNRNFVTSFLDPLIAFVSTHAWLAYLTLFLAALLEAVSGVGAGIPGAPILLAPIALGRWGEHRREWGLGAGGPRAGERGRAALRTGQPAQR